MKPTLQFTEIRSRRDSAANLRLRSIAPKTDYNFRPNSLEDFSGWGGRKRFPSIREISNDYFDYEARSHFKSEAAFFGLIVATIAVPLFQVVRALFVWVL